MKTTECNRKCIPKKKNTKKLKLKNFSSYNISFVFFLLWKILIFYIQIALSVRPTVRPSDRPTFRLNNSLGACMSYIRVADPFGVYSDLDPPFEKKKWERRPNFCLIITIYTPTICICKG